MALIPIFRFSHYDGRMSTVAGSQERSKLLFGNIHLLSIAAAISDGDGTVDSKSLQLQLTLGQTAVHRALKVFEGVGLLERKARAGRTAPQVYLRVTHDFWHSASNLHATAGVSETAA